MDNGTEYDLITTYPTDENDLDKFDIIGRKGDKYYRLDEDGNVQEEYVSKPEYHLGFWAEEQSLTEAIDVTRWAIDEYRKEYPEG